MPLAARHQAAASSGVSHAENGTGRLPCLRRLNRSSSAAATTCPSTTSAAAGSWKIALIPSTFTPRSGTRVEPLRTNKVSVEPKRLTCTDRGTAAAAQQIEQYIAGDWTSGSGSETFTVFDPSDGGEVSRAPLATPDDVAAAVKAARAAQPGWA